MSSRVRVGLHLSVQAGKDEPHDQAVSTAIEDVRKAERLGFSAALFAEHHFIEDGWVPQALTMAAAAAAVTERIRVGSNIMILPLQHPATVAEQAVLVDLISKGRCILGVGAGWRIEDFKGYGLPMETRFKGLADGLKVVRGLLEGNTVTYEGVNFKLEDARLRLLPVQEKGIPLWVGATGPQGIRRSARLGDSWILSPQVRVGKLAEGRKMFDEARAEAGLPPVKDVPLRREAYVAETDDQAWDEFADGLRHQYGKVYGSRHPDFPTDGSLESLKVWAKDLCVVGSVETVTEEFLALNERLGATDILVRNRLPGVDVKRADYSLELFGEVAKLLEQAG